MRNSERAERITASANSLAKLFLLCCGIWAKPNENPVFKYDVLWAFGPEPFDFAARTLHNR